MLRPGVIVNDEPPEVTVEAVGGVVTIVGAHGTMVFDHATCSGTWTPKRGDV